MHLRIQEKNYSASDNSFDLSLLFDGHTAFSVKLTPPRDPKLDLWEWYFEEYPQTADPDTLSRKRAAEVEESIRKYGKNLFDNLFENKKAYSRFEAGLREDGLANLIIEIDSESTAFHAIHWETLFYDGFDHPLALLNGVRFFRKNYRPVDFEARVAPLPYLNLLIVTARPREEEDVNYRTIQRPVVEAIRRSGRRVRVYILRPGTSRALVKHLEDKGEGFYHIIHFDVHGNVFNFRDLKRERKKHQVQFSTFNFTAHNFQVNWGLDDVEPFEGEKAFLYFESDRKGVAVPVEANELAGQLKQHRIPVCILNACQSAKQAYTSNETSIGKILVESGMELVLAMRYSVLASAATIFMTEFYTRLFQNKTVEQAIGSARRELHHNKNRPLGNGALEMEDWLLPVVYINKGDVDLQLRDFANQAEKNSYYFEKAARPVYPANFIGRDLDILKIEKLLSNGRNHLFLKGVQGVGKTILLRYLAAWWDETNFVEHACYFSFNERKWTLSELVRGIAERLLPREERNDFLGQEPVIQRMELLDWLNKRRVALLLDDIGVEQAPLLDFLRDIRESPVLYAGEEAPAWIQPLIDDNEYTLKSYTAPPRPPAGVGKNDDQPPELQPGPDTPPQKVSQPIPTDHKTKPPMPDLSPIRQLIARNQIEKAFKELFALAPANGELITLSADYEELVKQNRIGIITTGEYSTKRNKIVFGLLGVISVLENEE